MKNKKIVLLGSVLFLSVLCASNVPVKSVRPPNNENLQTQNLDTADVPKKEVLSYVDVLRTYYNLATENVENPSVDFNAFYDDYYAPESDRDLYAFTLKLATDNGNFESVYDTLNIENYESIPSSFDSLDQNYILKSIKNDHITPENSFKREPYTAFYDYSSLQDGYIVYETDTSMFNVGHNALIDSKGHDSFYGPYIRTIEAVLSGVKFGFLDDLRMTSFKCKILKVDIVGVGGIEAAKAIYFAREQLGKPYGFNVLAWNIRINAATWYCSELVYACYKAQGIDICVKKDKDGKDVHVGLVCLPIDIYNSYNTSEVNMHQYGFLNLGLAKRKGKTWTVFVYNESKLNINMEYNTKMCNKGDAKKWKGLKDIKNIKMSAGEHVFVEVTENWFATSIAFSFKNGEYRIISYADNFNKPNGSIKRYYNVIKEEEKEE